MDRRSAKCTLGIPEFEDKRYEGRVKERGILVSAQCANSDEIKAAKDIFRCAEPTTSPPRAKLRPTSIRRRKSLSPSDGAPFRGALFFPSKPSFRRPPIAGSPRCSMGEGQPEPVRATVLPQFESAIWRPRIFPLNGLCCDRGVIAKRIIVTSNINLTLSIMTPLILATPMLAAAG